MLQNKRYFAATLQKGGKLSLIFFYSLSERTEFCNIKENHTRPITMDQWRKVPKDMKA